MPRLYANTKSFYIRDLSICGFWYQNIGESTPYRCCGKIVQQSFKWGSYDPNLGSYSLDTIKLISFKCSRISSTSIIRSSPKFNFRTFSSSPKEKPSASHLPFLPSFPQNWSFVSGIVFLSSFMLQHWSVLHSFLLPNSIPLYGYTTFSLSIRQLMGIKAVSTFWLLWLLLLWIFFRSQRISYQAKDPICRTGSSTLPDKHRNYKIPLK